MKINPNLIGGVYSSNEINTGKKWIDNKTIYRKVVTTPKTTGMPSTTNLGITNVDTICYVYVMCIVNRTSGGLQYKAPYYYDASDFYRWWVNTDSSGVTIIFNGNQGSNDKQFQITIEYTKT